MKLTITSAAMLMLFAASAQNKSYKIVAKDKTKAEIERCLTDNGYTSSDTSNQVITLRGKKLTLVKNGRKYKTVKVEVGFECNGLPKLID